MLKERSRFRRHITAAVVERQEQILAERMQALAGWIAKAIGG